MTTETVAQPTAASPAPSTTNTPGRVSLAIAVVIVALGIAQQIVSQTVPFIMQADGMNVASVGVIFGVFGAIIGAVATIGLVFGLLGLARVSSPRLAAAAGTAIAVSTLVSVVIGAILPVIMTALY